MRRPFVAFSTFTKKIESISSDRSAWDEVGKKNGLGELAARLKVSAFGQIAISDQHVPMVGFIQMRVELGRQFIFFRRLRVLCPPVLPNGGQAGVFTAAVCSANKAQFSL